MMRATTMTEFRDSIKHLGLVMFNILYADKHGDVFYISNGRVPKRDTRIPSTQLRPGDQAWARWQGFHPLEDLPQVANPSAGYLVNTNSGPHNVTPDGAPNLNDFPHYMNDHQANSRLRRLDHLIRNDQSLTFEEMKTYATDTMVEVDEEYIARIYTADELGVGEDRELLQNSIATLKEWDRRTDLESRGAVLFHYLAKDNAFNAAVSGQDPAVIALGVVRVAKQVQQQFGSIDVPWKEFSRIRRGEIEIGVAGSGGIGSKAGPALCPTNGEIRKGKRYCSGGSSYGMIVDFSGKTNAISCLPFGVSEDPSSPYFANMLPLYANRQFKPAWFFPDEVKANARSELTLSTLE
jgi:acyl-homoserine-lactone acylase